MHPMLLIEAVLLLLLSGATVTTVQAASMKADVAQVANGSSEALLSRVSLLAVDRPNAVLNAPNDDLGVQLSIANPYFTDAHFAGNYLAGTGLRVNPIPFDGLIAAHASGHFKVGLQDQSMGLADQSMSYSYVNQPSAVPLSTAAWLFASALLGFVTVANRRKV
jgi:hypothetical protein